MTKIKLRQKPISGNRQTLYLDIYPPIIHPETGKPTRRDFLGLYILDKPKTITEKLHNKETLQLAENIKAKRQLEIQSGNYGFLISKKAPVNLLEFYKSIIDKPKSSPSSLNNWRNSYLAFKSYCKEYLSLDRIDEDFCMGYRDYLLNGLISKTYKKPLAQNTASFYFDKFRTVLKEAYKLELIKKDIASKIAAIPRRETHREYLSLEELHMLVNTESKSKTIKRASLFSALTGLRISDIIKLSWGEVKHSQAEGYYISFRQKKTKGVETLPISEQAIQLIGERQEPEVKVFQDLNYNGAFHRKFDKWIKTAGITKKISFHNLRHTFATLQLSLGTDIYTVSKMLGHRDLKTTQIYAKIIDKSKREAANRIKLELNI